MSLLKGGGSDGVVTISSIPIYEGETIDTSVYYYKPLGPDTKDEKLFLADSNGKAVEVPFLNKEPQTISLSTNHVELDLVNLSEDIIVTCDGTVDAESSDPSIASCSVTNNTVTITLTGSGSCNIFIIANAIQTKMSATAIVTVYANGDAAASSAPVFNADNFAPLDTTATRKYYFGQYGNAFYGVSDGSVEAVTGTGQASGEVPYYELVDTDCLINNTYNRTQWGTVDAYIESPYYTRFRSANGQRILDYTNNLKNSYFNNVDINAIKHAGVEINTTDKYSGCSGSISSDLAYMWPLSYTQLNENQQLVNMLGTNAGIGNIGRYVWVRSYGDRYNGGNYVEVKTYYIYGNVSNGFYLYNGDFCRAKTNLDTYPYTIDYTYPSLYVAPAFNLDLAKVLLPKPALSDSTSTNPTDISVKVSEDNKFLINAGSAKSDFTVNLAGEYSVTEITSVNSGTNYISFIIYDLSGIAICYGNLSALTQTSGTIDFKEDIFDNLESLSFEPGPYTLAIFQEEKCNSYKTDYASEPCYFRFLIN